jgi:hypothetical protein
LASVINLLNISDNVDLSVFGKEFFRMGGAKQNFDGAAVTSVDFFF